MTNTTLLMSILVMGICTLLLRALPYLVLNKASVQKPWLVFIKRMMPAGMMAILVLFCIHNIDFVDAFEQNWPTLVAMMMTAVCHQMWRNPFLSIVFGTLIFMSLQGCLLTLLS